MSAKAIVPLADGLEEIEAVTIIDVLRRGGVEVVTAAVGGSRSVAGAHGIRMEADALLSDVSGEEYNAVILPGGPGTQSLKTPEVFDLLRRQKAGGGLVCAICAAPSVLVEAGVLDEGQHVTCYPTCVMDLDRPCAGVPVVADGKVITGQAPGSALLFALIVLQTLSGEPVARKVARSMVTDVL